MPDSDLLIRDLVESTREVFSTMIAVNLDEGPNRRGVEVLEGCQVMGMVGLAGNSHGIVSVHCSHTLAMTITSNMLGMPITHMGDEVKDAVGEVTNMVAGSFKNRLSKGGELLNLSVPTVIVGDNFTIKTLSNAPSLVLEFPWRGEALYVRLDLKEA